MIQFLLDRAADLLCRPSPTDLLVDSIISRVRDIPSDHGHTQDRLYLCFSTEHTERVMEVRSYSYLLHDVTVGITGSVETGPYQTIDLTPRQCRNLGRELLYLRKRCKENRVSAKRLSQKEAVSSALSDFL